MSPLNFDLFLQIFYHLWCHQCQIFEFVLCLIGDKEKDYIITEIYKPEIIRQMFNSVSFKQCSKETLIVLHSHPNNRCIASSQDISMLNDLKNINQDSAMMIMCNQGRFSLYK